MIVYTTNPLIFYMGQYENTSFGWAPFDIDDEYYYKIAPKNVYKPVGQDSKTKSFSYDIDVDGQTDTLSDLSILYKEVVLFFKFLSIRLTSLRRKTSPFHNETC